MHLLFGMISLLIIFAIPGYSLFLTPFGRKASRKLDPFELIFLIVLVSTIASSWFGLLLAEFAHFSLINLLLADILFSLLLIFGTKSKLTPFRPGLPLKRSHLIIIAILILALFLFGKPGECIFGGRDPGVYVNMGINIAKRGSIIFENKASAVLPPELKPLFLKGFRPNQMGIYIASKSKLTLVPQFYHLFPLWYGILYSIFGIRFALFLPAIFGVLGVGALYLLGKRFYGEKVGLLASFLLSINVIAIWFARFPTSEILVQYLLLSGIFLLDLFLEEGDPVFGVLSGLSLGLTMLVRVDCSLLVIPVSLFVLGLFLSHFGKKTLFFALPFSLLVLHFFLHGEFIAHYYLWNTFARVLNDIKLWMKLAPIALLLFLIAVIISSRLKALFRRVMAYKHPLPLLTAISLSLALFYAYFYRPYFIYGWNDPNAGTYHRMGWFLTDFGVIAGSIVFIYLWYRLRRGAEFFFLSSVLFFAGFYFYRIRVIPDYFWVMRRFVPLIYPGLVLFIAYLIGKLWDLGQRKRFLRVASILILAYLLYSFISYDKLIYPHREFAGAINLVKELKREIKPGSLVITENISTSLIHLVSLPLSTLSGSEVAELRYFKLSPWLLEKLLPYWGKNFRQIYLLTSWRTEIPDGPYYFGLVEEKWFKSSFMEFSYNRPPREEKGIYIKMTLKRLIHPSELSKEGKTIDVGEDDILLRSGFYQKEKEGTVSFRWTGRIASVYLPSLANASTITLRMDGGRPQGIKKPEVSFYLLNEKIGELTVENGFNTYRIPIPERIRKKLTREKMPILYIKSTTMNPTRDLGSPDIRELGVKIDYISWD